MKNKQFVSTSPMMESDDYRETIIFSGYSEKPETVIEAKFLPNMRAKYAMEFLQSNGINSIVEDGETTDGHFKFRKETPAELVTRAVETSDALFNEFEKRGWLHKTTAFSKQLETMMVARKIQDANEDN